MNACMFHTQVVPGHEGSSGETEYKEDEEKASEKEQDVFEDAKDHSTVTDFARFLG